MTAKRDISSCAYIAQLGDTNDLGGPLGFVRTRRTPIGVSGAVGPNVVMVETFDMAGAPSDRSFHLAVYC